MAYKHGHFVWFEIVTPNPDDARAFWTEVGGFTAEHVDMGAPTPYLMLKGPGGTVGGVVAPRMDGVPPHVTGYLSVDDVDAVAAKVAAHGGQVLVPPTDLGIGRFAVVSDPQGATFRLWKDKTGDDQRATGVDWMELWSRDAEQVVPFYQAVFGHEHAVMEMPMGPYHLLNVAGQNAAGVMVSPDPSTPPMWLAYLSVDDVDAAVARARAAGGAVHAEPMEVEGVGRFAIIADRQGVTAGVMRPASR